jgi:hypothetical protein
MKLATVTTSPWKAAVDRFSDKTVVGSKLRSAEWSDMPIALRERAFFSAGVDQARTLSAMREKVVQGLDQSRPGGIGMNRARFVADMRNLLGAAPGDSGSLTDITSTRRLNLIWDFQTADAHGFASQKADMDPDRLDAFPAYRLLRVESRRVPRDWYARWGEAGAKVGWVGASKTEMVALKTSPIWIALSRFGKPWPPFDYSSGMGLEDVDRDEAEALGLLDKNEDPAARLQSLGDAAATASQDWNDGLQASVKGIDQETRNWLKDAFGDQISIDGDTVAWRSGATTEIIPPAPIAVPTPEPVAPPMPLPDIDRVATAVVKATSREEAHAILALPLAERGSLVLSPTESARSQTEKARAFIGSILHKDAAPAASCKVVVHAGRAYYSENISTATVRLGDVGCTIHELGHHIECSDPEILRETKDFIRSRIQPGDVPERLSKLTGSSYYGPSEVAYKDEWAERGGSPYAGKVYRGGLDEANATEVLTMGLERLYDDPAAFARQDPDYFKFILRVLRPTP